MSNPSQYNQNSDPSSETVKFLKLGKFFEDLSGNNRKIETIVGKSLFGNGQLSNAVSENGNFAIGYQGGAGRYSFNSVTNTTGIHIKIYDDNRIDYNSIATIAEFVPSSLDASYTDTYVNSVVVRSDLSVDKTSYIDASLSATYMDSTARITFVDQYLSNNSFTDSSSNFTCSFDLSNSTYVPTRNVNSQAAHIDASGNHTNLPGVSATEYTNNWNTNGNFGPFYLAGDVSLNSFGKPILDPFPFDSSKNLLNNNYSIDLITSPLDIDPSFGRYAADVSSENNYLVIIDGSNIDISYTIVTNLRICDTDVLNDLYDLSLNDLSLNILPNVVGDANSSNPILDYVVDASNTLQVGFTLSITSDNVDSSMSLYNNANTAPISIDTSNMSFATQNMYNLQESVNGDYTLNNDSSNNYVSITNGSTDLSGNNASNGSITLGTTAEYLTIDQSGNGYVTFPSVDPLTGSSGELVHPRATDISNNSSYFNEFIVRYETTDSRIVTDASDILQVELKTAETVTYKIEKLITETTPDISANYDDYIGYSNGAISFLYDNNNTVITSSDISFTNDNSLNSYTEPIYVIDFLATINMEEINLYYVDGSSNISLDEIAFSGTATNLDLSNVSIADIQVMLTQKVLPNLTTDVSGVDFSLNYISGSALVSSNEYESFLEMSDIMGTLDGSITGPLEIKFGPAEDLSSLASKYSKFYDKLDFIYNGNTSTTYDDELVYNTIDSSNVELTLDGSYANIPSGCTLHKLRQTDIFTVTTPFRFGNYSNISITTSEITKVVTYYSLTLDSNGRELPRRNLAPITLNEYPITADVIDYTAISYWNFTQADLKPYFINVQTEPSNNNIGTSSVDMWYNTTTAVSSPIGTFYFAYSLPLSIYTLDIPVIYGDLQLVEGTQTFSINGKSFSQDDILNNNMQTINWNTYQIPSYGTDLSFGTVTYDVSGSGLNIPGITTLSSSGYSFVYNNNLLLNIRILVITQNIFIVTESIDSSSNTVIAYPNNYYIKCANGIYVGGDLNSTFTGDFAIWQLNNDWATVSLYNGDLSANYHITMVPETFDASGDIARNVTLNWFRGYNVGTTNIIRTETSVTFNMSGYSETHSMYYNNIITNIFGGLNTTDNLSMYASSVTSTQIWLLQLDSYGTYTVSYQNSYDVSANITYVPAYNLIIYEGANKTILNDSLNTSGFNYELNYIGGSLFIYYISDYTNTSTDLNDYEFIYYFTEIDLSNPIVINSIGNILDIHLIFGYTMPDITTFFSICPPFMQFSAIDSSGVDDIPFTPDYTDVNQYKIFYQAVNDIQTYNPFSGSNINDITFVDERARTYLDYYLNFDSSSNDMIIEPYNFIVDLKPGLLDASGSYTTYYDGLITESSSSSYYIGPLDASGEFRLNLNQIDIIPELSSMFDTSNNIFNIHNLRMTIGSAFISDSSMVYLEFVAGDSVTYTTYFVESIDISDGTMDVTIGKYYTNTSITLAHLNATTYHSMVLFGTYKQTKTYSLLIPTALPPTSPLDVRDFINNIAEYIDTNSAITWSDEELVDPSGVAIELYRVTPISQAGLITVVAMYAVNSNITRSIALIDLQDRIISRDKSGNTIFRLKYSGAVTTPGVTSNYLALTQGQFNGIPISLPP